MTLDLPIKEGQTVYYWDDDLDNVSSGVITSIQLTSYAKDKYDADVYYRYEDAYDNEVKVRYGRIGSNVWLSKQEVPWK